MRELSREENGSYVCTDVTEIQDGGSYIIVAAFDSDANGTIDGEDATMITSASYYNNCNPNWAISVELAALGGKEYQVVRVAVTPGSASAAGIRWNSGDLVMVVHSAASAPGEYANWMSKVAAMALRAGDIVTLADDWSTVTVVSAGELEDANEDGIPDRYGVAVDENGNYSFENAYGYTFSIDDVNGIIEGEDATLITNASDYNDCNPNWAISVALRQTGNTEYEVIKVAVTPGSAPAAGIDWNDCDMVMVVHSASSYPGDYANWMSKVAAIALHAGDIVTVSDDMSTVTVNR